eukprot:11418307-Heterocapsa_arctica.AAC.1
MGLDLNTLSDVVSAWIIEGAPDNASIWEAVPQTGSQGSPWALVGDSPTQQPGLFVAGDAKPGQQEPCTPALLLPAPQPSLPCTGLEFGGGSKPHPHTYCPASSDALAIEYHRP